MATQIPRDRWPAFLDLYSQHHYGWLVRVESAGSESPERLPLDALALTVDRGSEALTITLTDPHVPQGHRQVTIQDVRHIVDEGEERGEAVLVIRSGGGTARLRLERAPATRHAV